MIVCWFLYMGQAVKTYSHDTENTFRDTKNIHYDTVKKYINYTEKKLQFKTTPLAFPCTVLSVHFSVRAFPSKRFGHVFWFRFEPVKCSWTLESRVPASVCTRPAPLEEPPESFTVADRRPLQRWAWLLFQLLAFPKFADLVARFAVPTTAADTTVD